MVSFGKKKDTTLDNIQRKFLNWPYGYMILKNRGEGFVN
jgi:hypothetical protein